MVSGGPSQKGGMVRDSTQSLLNAKTNVSTKMKKGLLKIKKDKKWCQYVGRDLS